MREKIWILFSILIIIFIGCTSHHANNVDKIEPTIFANVSSMLTSEYFDYGDAVDFIYEKNQLKIIDRVNYVGCANIILDSETVGNTLTITEKNVGDMCKCPAVYLVEITVYDPPENIILKGVSFKKGNIDIPPKVRLNLSLNHLSPDDLCVQLCKSNLNIGRDLSSGPCLSNHFYSSYVCDVAHSPRISIDNDKSNQCLSYVRGIKTNYVEVDPNCDLIKVS